MTETQQSTATSTKSLSEAPYNPVARAIWEGSIPVEISWDSAEASKYGAKEHCLLMTQASRCSYLPLLTNEVWRHIRNKSVHMSLDQSNVWYEYDGAPLKWHYPIGLLYDIHGLQAAASRGTMDSPPLPWKIIAHVENFPVEKLIKITSENSCQDYFMSMIKEADYLRNGSTKKVMNMSKSDQTQLWDGMWTKSYDLFWGMNQKLALNDGTMARYLPVRIYLPENCPVVQEPVSPVDDEGQPRTLRQILNIALPDLFPLEETPGQPARASVIIHGIVPSLDASAVWFAQTMAYPDNFLHLVVIINI
ncbi:autophagy protein 5 [Mortierella sp. AD094]|nr:autophagy protein 5 [Mortierella sp. AD094]